MFMQSDTQIKNYHELRLNRFDYRYRLRRRAQEVINAIKKYSIKDSPTVLDVGTADGLMLKALGKSKNINITRSIGLDASTESFKLNEEKAFEFVQGDALILPFKDGVFDVIIAAAILEHVPNINEALSEFNRVCAINGICIATTPDPRIDKIGTLIGYNKDPELHVQTLTLSTLADLFKSARFKVLKAEKIMLSPIGLLPFEQKVEEVIRKIGLDGLMCNQLMVCQKTDSPLSALSD